MNPFGKLGNKKEPIHYISNPSQKIKNGEVFALSSNGTLTAGQSIASLFKHGDVITDLEDFAVKVSTGLVTIELFENPTVTADGTEVFFISRNRANSNVSKVRCFVNPTVTNNGTLLYTTQIHETSQGVSRNSGGAGISREWILNKNTNYLFKITNNSADIITYSTEGVWSEERA